MTEHVSPNDPAILDAVPGTAPKKPRANKAPKIPAMQTTPEQDAVLEARVNVYATAPKEIDDGDDVFRTKILPLFEKTRADYLALARRTALFLSKKLARPITVDDVRRIAPPPLLTGDGKPVDGRVMGGIFTGKDWTSVGHVRSTRATCHKRHVMRFERTY